MAMMNFDQKLFINTYNNLLSEKSFRDVFFEIFVPLMNEIGLLWQSETISPAHEHFISFMIKQKVLVNTEKVQLYEPTRNDKIFVLYLPENEIHELGLMYLNYEITLNGFKTIYLGESVPISSLKDIQKYFDNVTFISYMTVEPTKDDINEYLTTMENEILKDTQSELWTLGRLTEFIKKEHHPNVKVFSSIQDLSNNL